MFKVIFFELERKTSRLIHTFATTAHLLKLDGARVPLIRQLRKSFHLLYASESPHLLVFFVVIFFFFLLIR